jgi:Tol biopolymer transport system component
LFLLPTGPGQPAELAGGDFAAYFWGSFLPDGKHVVYAASGKDGSARFYVQAVAGGKPQAIGPDRLRPQDGTNPVSPDGKHLIGVRRGEVHLISLDGAGEDRILPGLSVPDDRLPQWSQDSHHLYVYRRGERPAKVWLYDVATGERRLWRELPYDNSIEAIRIRMTPDGQAWTTEGRRTLGQLYVVEGLR